MISAFDLEKLKELLRDFYRLTRIRVVLFDIERREMLAWPENRPDFCRIIRSAPAGARACRACDKDACDAALKGRDAYIYRCHAGLTETIMPLYVGQVPVGFLLFGHVFAYDDFAAGWETVSRRCAAYGVDMDDLKAACKTMPCMDQDYIRSASHILHATASFLLMERMATLQADSAAARLDAWIARHYTEKITAEDACGALGISRSRLFRLTGQLYGCGLSGQVKKLRMERARQLLRERPDLNITEIASACGFSDYNYFIAVFSGETGVSPGAYRRGRRGSALKKPL